MMRTYLKVAAVLAAAALAGCGSSPKSSFYTLSSSAPYQQAPATESFGIAISAVAVPDVIDRPQFVTRTGANELVINEFARWGEPLKGEIPRVMAADLSRELGGADDAKNLWPQPYGSQPWNAVRKDCVETRLHTEVCAGHITLKQAQDAIRFNWTSAYLRYYENPEPGKKCTPRTN